MAAIPNATRYLIAVMASLAVLGVAVAVSAYLERDHPIKPVTWALGGVTFVVSVGFLRVGVPLLWRRLFARVMRGGGVMCDVYPAGFPDAKTAMLIDARMSDAQAAQVRQAIARWCSWMASNPSGSAHVGGVFADGPIRSAEELVGPDGRGGFLVAGESGTFAGWRLVLPEAQPGDPRRPYVNGVVVEIRVPTGS